MSAAVTLCFLLRDTTTGPEVLLGLKKTGFGAGKVVGIGGHVEPGESAVAAICREVAEESSLIVAPSDLEPAGTVDFVFPAKPALDMFTTLFLTRTFTGVARESKEIAPRWYSVTALPHEHMWADASHWLPAILAGERGHWRVVLNDDNETVAASSFLPAATAHPGTCPGAPAEGGGS